MNQMCFPFCKPNNYNHHNRYFNKRGHCKLIFWLIIVTSPHVADGLLSTAKVEFSCVNLSGSFILFSISNGPGALRWQSLATYSSFWAESTMQQCTVFSVCLLHIIDGLELKEFALLQIVWSKRLTKKPSDWLASSTWFIFMGLILVWLYQQSEKCQKNHISTLTGGTYKPAPLCTFTA